MPLNANVVAAEIKGKEFSHSFPLISNAPVQLVGHPKGIILPTASRVISNVPCNLFVALSILQSTTNFSLCSFVILGFCSSRPLALSFSLF